MKKKELRKYAKRGRMFFKERDADGHVVALEELDPKRIFPLYGGGPDEQTAWAQTVEGEPWVAIYLDDLLLIKPQREKIRL